MSSCPTRASAKHCGARLAQRRSRWKAQPSFRRAASSTCPVSSSGASRTGPTARLNPATTSFSPLPANTQRGSSRQSSPGLTCADVKRLICVIAAAFTLVLADSSAAGAAEVHVWTTRAIATVLAEIGPQFERATGHRLNVYSGLPDDFEKRLKAGNPLDLLISGSAPVDEWIKQGRLVAATRTGIARSGIGVEVRAGARKPDISSVDAFKRALLDAKSIAYLNVGSGIYVQGLLERLGIAGAVTSKVTRPETDIVSELVAKGEVELGLVVITQILTTRGVELVGPLPREIQSYVDFAAAVGVNSKTTDAAKQLIKFLSGPAAIAVIKKQ